METDLIHRDEFRCRAEAWAEDVFAGEPDNCKYNSLLHLIDDSEVVGAADVETEKLIEALRRYGLKNGTSLGRHMGIMDEAADILECLTAENAEKDAEIERKSAEIERLHKRRIDLSDERDRLQAELDAAVEDIHFALEDLMDAAITPCTYCMGNPLNGGVCDMENENHEMFACWVWRGWRGKENGDGKENS